jgi:serine/threonine protein phosphatase PrpC
VVVTDMQTTNTPETTGESAMETCPSCRETVAADEYFCAGCGTPLRPDSSAKAADAEECPCHGGEAAVDSDGFCEECGRQTRAPVRAAHDHEELVLSPDFGGVTDVGRKHRVNEDALLISARENRNGRFLIVAVCDGVSTSSEADLASGAAVHALRDAANASLDRSEGMVAAIRKGANAAQEAVLAVPYPKGGESPASTLVAAIVLGGKAVLAWAGDSRAYLVGCPEQRQLTRDDSWINDVVDRGVMTLEQAKNHRYAHAIVNSLGEPPPDETFKVNVAEFDLPAEGALLLCSDGLYNYADSAEELTALIPATGEAVDACRAMVAFANAQGGHDNITAAMLRLKPAA